MGISIGAISRRMSRWTWEIGCGRACNIIFALLCRGSICHYDRRRLSADDLLCDLLIDAAISLSEAHTVLIIFILVVNLITIFAFTIRFRATLTSWKRTAVVLLGL